MKTNSMPYCSHIEDNCVKDKCDSYGNKLKTEYEADMLWPSKDLYIRNWCFRYNRRVVPLIKK